MTLGAQNHLMGPVFSTSVVFLVANFTCAVPGVAGCKGAEEREGVARNTLWGKEMRRVRADQHWHLQGTIHIESGQRSTQRRMHSYTCMLQNEKEAEERTTTRNPKREENKKDREN